MTVVNPLAFPTNFREGRSSLAGLPAEAIYSDSAMLLRPRVRETRLRKARSLFTKLKIDVFTRVQPCRTLRLRDDDAEPARPVMHA